MGSKAHNAYRNGIHKGKPSNVIKHIDDVIKFYPEGAILSMNPVTQSAQLTTDRITPSHTVCVCVCVCSVSVSVGLQEWWQDWEEWARDLHQDGQHRDHRRAVSTPSRPANGHACVFTSPSSMRHALDFVVAVIVFWTPTSSSKVSCQQASTSCWCGQISIFLTKYLNIDIATIL